MGKLSEKLVIYLDQNFISEIAKAEINSKVRKEFRELFELLHKGFLEEKLVVPSSWFQKIETCLAPELKERIGEVQAYMGQISMENKENIYTCQLGRAANGFLGIKNKPLDYKIAFHENPDQILEFYKISIDMHWERYHNKEEREELALKIDANREEIRRVSYGVQLNREIFAYVNGFLINGSWRVSYLFGKDLTKIKNFAFSENFKTMPIVEIGSKLWAKIITAHGNRKIKSGDATDIDVISSYLPYVDVLAIDNFMANTVKELKIDEKYKTIIFDAKGEGLIKFINFIADYLEKNEPVNVPDASVFVLSDSKIKGESFEFFRRLGSLCSRHYIDVYGFDDGNMPRYLHKVAGVEMPFSGLQEVHSIKINPNLSKDELVKICKEKCRSRFVLIDHYKDLPDNFIKTLIKYCEEGKNMILDYNIYEK